MLDKDLADLFFTPYFLKQWNDTVCSLAFSNRWAENILYQW